MSSLLTEEIIKQIDQLPDEQQMKLLDFVRSLPNVQYVGVPGESLLRFAGFIPHDELERMEKVIEDGCEQAAANEWQPPIYC